MQRRHRITLVAIAGVLALGIGGCKNKKEINAAKSSVYDTDFAIVFSAALEAVREQYTNVDDFPQNGMIKTAWHQVSYANNQDDLSNPRTVSSGPGMTNSGAMSPTGVPTRLAYKRNFIRFDVSVVGGRPWRVKVVGHAAEWDPGNAMPTELRGAARPPWLDGRIESLQVAIYRRMKQFALPMKEEVEIKEVEVPKTDPSTIKGVPPAAATVLAAIKDAIERRDYATLRTLIADDVVWSAGGAPGADTAMAMWQADPETLEAMTRAIAAGCGSTDKGVSCPAGAPVAGQWQLVVEPRGSAWKVTSYVRAE
jgi:hypothetical protein